MPSIRDRMKRSLTSYMGGGKKLTMGKGAGGASAAAARLRSRMSRKDMLNRAGRGSLEGGSKGATREKPLQDHYNSAAAIRDEGNKYTTNAISASQDVRRGEEEERAMDTAAGKVQESYDKALGSFELRREKAMARRARQNERLSAGDAKKRMKRQVPARKR